MRILVVDDSIAVRSRVVFRLREAGHEVVGEAGDAEAALRMARLRDPEAVVLDLRLPGRSGLDILPELKASGRGPLVLVLTNAAHARGRCLALGADFFLDKSSAFDVSDALLACLGAEG